VVSGCGGESSRGLTGGQLVRRAQTICLRAQSGAGAMLPPSHRAGLPGTAGYFARSASIVEAKTNALRALKLRASGRIARQWRAVISAEAAFAAHLRRLGAAAASGEEIRLKLVEADLGPEQDLIRHATQLGVTLCAP
jgi:hypothetical protein